LHSTTKAVKSAANNPALRYFWLIRHARSSETGRSDFERELSADGHADGKLVADFLQQQYQQNIEGSLQVPSWLITSAASRAIQTSAYIADGFSITPERTCVEQSLYLANPETLIAAIKETPAEENCVALVAHNPGLTWLVNELSANDQQLDNLPTLGCALFSSDAAHWSDVGEVNRVSLFTPKKIGRKRKK